MAAGIIMAVWSCVNGRVSQNRIYAPYMTVYLVISLPKIPYIHRIYIVLANPSQVSMVGLARTTIYIRCINSNFGREISIYIPNIIRTIYTRCVYIRSWPTLFTSHTASLQGKRSSVLFLSVRMLAPSVLSLSVQMPAPSVLFLSVQMPEPSVPFLSVQCRHYPFRFYLC